jgi:hypothetical protein
MNNKILLLIVFCILLSNVSGLSTIEAQNIAKEYVLENEFIDSRVFNISCENEEFFVVSVVNTKNELVFFVPIDEEKNIYVKKDKKNENVFKATYFLREITKQNQENYLSAALIEAINNQITILSSKNAQLQGIITANYSLEITTASENTKEDLLQLIELLENLRESLENARQAQQSFIDDPSCERTNTVILSLKDAFVGYNNLTLLGLNYQNSVNLIIETIVADTQVEENTKMIIQGYVSAPRDLSRDISYIQERTSSTHFFYKNIIDEILKSGDSNPTNMLLNNLISRQDYVVVNQKLYVYDDDLKNSLDNFVQTILDSHRYSYWKDRITLEDLEKNYQEINNLINRKRYLEATSKITLLKSQAIKIESEGFIDVSNVQQSFDYYLLIAVVLLLVFLFFVIKKKPSKKKIKKKDKSNQKDFLESFNSKDPFK